MKVWKIYGESQQGGEDIRINQSFPILGGNNG
jgi:hypothetical protein